MPANLPPPYHEAERRWRAAKTPGEQLAALEEMLRLMPKHKGTDHLQADIKARIAKLRKEPQKGGPKRTNVFVVDKEGAGQVALAGAPNTGKSALLAGLTKARPEVADYPHTTREPMPGMMPFEDVSFQLVDLPPLSRDYTEPALFDVFRRAELLWLVVSGRDPLDDLELAESLLAEKKIAPVPVGDYRDESAVPGMLARPTLLVATGLDLPGARGNLEAFAELTGRRWTVEAVSTVSREGLDALARRTFAAFAQAFGMFRVYAKEPGKPPDKSAPFILTRGDTVADLAGIIHGDLRERVKNAKIWGSGAFDGQVVPREHPLVEGDVVQLNL